MVKKLLTFALGLTLAFGALAQTGNNAGHMQPPQPKDISFSEDDIEFWVGTGSNTSMVIIAWDDNYAGDDFALVWGVRWSGNVTALDLVDSIATHDSRLTYDFSTAQGSHLMLDISYNDGVLVGNSPSGWCYYLNNAWAQNAYDGQPITDGDIIEISANCMFTMTDAMPATDPNPHTDPPTDPCTTAQSLPYEEDFSGYVDNTAIRPYMAGAMIPECWTVLGNGTTQYHYTANSETATYFGGVGYSTSTNSFGAITAYDAFLSLIASQIYTGDNASHIASMNSTGTCRYAVLPEFDQQLSQTLLTFDRRTSSSGAQLIVGYVTGDTSTFVGLETLAADNRTLHHDTIHFNQYNNMPNNARLALKWQVTSSTNSSTGPAYRYCGIDNLKVALDTASTTPDPPADPVDATLAHSEILYWVGEGSNEALFIVSFAEPDTAFAWGYRFNSATIQQMVNDIDAADPRLEIVGNPSYDGDIHFVLDNGDTLGLSPVDPGRGYNFWWTNLNGVSVASMTTALHNNDYFKYGDLNSATGWDFQNGYYMQEAWTKVPTPVTNPADTTSHDGIADVVTSVDRIWPNPANGYVNVETHRSCEAVLYDLAGRQMATYTFTEGINTINLSNLKNGIYMLRTEGSVRKIVKN